jgi:uncharacterized protein YggE
MNDAKAKAKQLAELGNVTLGKATYISETSTPIVYPEVFNAAGATATASGVTAISSGQTDITVDVQVAFAIQ